MNCAGFDVFSDCTKNAVQVQIVTSDEEWLQVRECLVRSFSDYALYRNLIANFHKRCDFLRQFLEANRQVTAKDGKSFVVSIGFKQDGKSKMTVVGGVMFAWQDTLIPDDELYMNEYIKQGMLATDREAFLRVLRYEGWESEAILANQLKSHLENWLIYFWGIDPKYCGHGIGSASYRNCMNVLQSKIRFFHDKGSKTKDYQSAKPPNLLLLTHSDRAAKFHRKNGFRETGVWALWNGSDQSHGFEWGGIENINVRVMIFDSFETASSNLMT